MRIDKIILKCLLMIHFDKNKRTKIRRELDKRLDEMRDLEKFNLDREALEDTRL